MMRLAWEATADVTAHSVPNAADLRGAGLKIRAILYGVTPVQMKPFPGAVLFPWFVLNCDSTHFHRYTDQQVYLHGPLSTDV